MSARSLRYALTVGSGSRDGPVRPNPLTLVGVGRGLSDDWPVGRAVAVAFAEVALEAFKKICPAAGADDEHVAAVVLVPLAAQIAERAERIQGAGDDRLRNSQHARQAADGMRARRQIDQHQ